MVDDRLQEAFSDDVGSLWCRPIAVLDSPPDPLSFLRDFVYPHVPCIIRNAIESEKGGPLILGLDDIVDLVGGEAELTVDVTPDGHGDCARCVRKHPADGDWGVGKLFVKPHEQKMTLADFRNHLRKQEGSNAIDSAEDTDINGLSVLQTDSAPEGQSADLGRVEKKVVYYSRQNDCLRTEMNSLFSTNIFPSSLGFAEECFNTGPPDAVNLWIGNQSSVSSMHKDHYENIFYVCKGQKEFILCPPADVMFLHEREFMSSSFCPSGSGGWKVVADGDEKTKWIEPDVKKYMDNHAYADHFPDLRRSHPVKVLVSEGKGPPLMVNSNLATLTDSILGDAIYIPSLWYHRVTQTCETVGINYW
ncbi:hypothetical protein THAOC_03394 [Thalassiosira oceanica]|uniref:JmjC domain-containing protein n=1 Tax=Thalassiosira oceanica TaxID=159749 RepID=K0TL04_THAOC|nr:hypothetical protein THAOC_03394 [Thalassiosira oceanica]|eukprot:EJK74901.1 hypothetical protein THAOC_03394 [Thalassiosira oceanica]